MAVNINRRNLLKKILAGVIVLPAVGLSSPNSTTGRAKLIPMEIGRIDGFRFIETPRISALKASILKHAVPREALGITLTYSGLPQKKGKTVKFRRPH